MTYAQYALLVDGHNRMVDPKRRRGGRGRAVDASWGEIAALKQVKVASG